MRLGKGMRLEVKWRMIGDVTTRSDGQGLGEWEFLMLSVCVVSGKAKEAGLVRLVLDDSRYRGQSSRGFSACEL